MRCLTVVLVVGVVLAPLAGCTPQGDPVPEPSSSAGPSPVSPGPAASSAPVPPPGAAAGPSSSGPSSSGPASAPRSSRPASSPAGPGEVPGELPHGERSLTGVVERSGDCTMLRVGARLWGLSGTAADELTPGDRVTVVGQVTTAGPGCGAADVLRGLIVRRVA